MIAKLYLHNKTFIHNDNDSSQKITNKIYELQSTIFQIKKIADENRIDKDQIFYNKEFYDIKIFEEHTVSQVAHGQLHILEHDTEKMLALIIDRNRECEENTENIYEKIRSNNEENLSGFLCLNSIDDPQLHVDCFIHEIMDWLRFHRCHLAHFPKDINNFFEEIKKYFLNINFHPRIRQSLNSLEGGVEKFSKKIILSLTILNDDFQTLAKGKQLSIALREFGLRIHEECSLEHNDVHERSFTFEFGNDGETRSVCCEPHIKFSRSGIDGDTHRYQNRIYFHQGLPEFCGGKILMGHIGRHL
jgi:hypothetical protein